MIFENEIPHYKFICLNFFQSIDKVGIYNKDYVALFNCLIKILPALEATLINIKQLQFCIDLKLPIS